MNWPLSQLINTSRLIEVNEVIGDSKCPVTGNPRTFYSIRHTYATFALTYDTINIHNLARQMGTSVVMIEKHYSHLDAEKATEQLGGEKKRGLLAS